MGTEQEIVAFDSQWLNTIQACFMKAKLSFLDCYAPVEKAEPLERGSLMHDMLEVYYALKGPRNFETKIWRDLQTAGLNVGEILNAPTVFGQDDFGLFVNFAKQVGRWSAVQKDLSGDIVDETIYQFGEYCSYYRNDSWQPLAVEEVGSKILFEDEKLQVIYNFKIDLVATNGAITVPFDHKTGARRSTPNSMSNQFIAYCFGLGVNNIIINKIGYQKTLSKQDRFQRFNLAISNSRIREWQVNSMWWIRRWMEARATGYYPMDLTSCDKYSGCIFRPICESDDEVREFKLDRDYKRIDQWDPSKELEEA